jgi:hypothetical protein
MAPRKWLNISISIVFFTVFSSAYGFPVHFFWDKDLDDNARLLTNVCGPPSETVLWSFEDAESSDTIEKSPQKLIRSGPQTFCLIHAFGLVISGILPHNIVHLPACPISGLLSVQLRC